jgi:uncharacterized protein
MPEVTRVQIDLAPFRNARHGDVTQRLSFRIPAGDTPLGPQVRVAEPTLVGVTVAGGPAGVQVAVRARLRVLHPCDRCLEDVWVDVPVDYREEWRFPAGRGAPAAAEVEDLDLDDADVVRRVVRGGSESLDDGFWQNVALELPAKVLCAEECRGLCPRCGANRNRTACACREPDMDVRLMTLLAWHPDGSAAAQRSAPRGTSPDGRPRRPGRDR